jgi:hypothetical protein
MTKVIDISDPEEYDRAIYPQGFISSKEQQINSTN